MKEVRKVIIVLPKLEIKELKEALKQARRHSNELAAKGRTISKI